MSPPTWACRWQEYQRIVQDTLGCQLLRLNDADGEDSALDRLPDGAPDPEASALDDSLRQAIIDAISCCPSASAWCCRCTTSRS
jgi:hypothetical protein